MNCCLGDIVYIPRHTWHYIVALDWDYAEKVLNSGTMSLYGATEEPGHAAAVAADTDDTNHRAHPCTQQQEQQYSFSVSFWWGPSIELDHG